MFNAFNRNPLTIEGIEIDINPIKKEGTGTIKEVLESPYHKEYLKGEK